MEKCLPRCLPTRMWSDTKLLVLASLFITILGLGFLWFGWNKTQPAKPNPSMLPAPSVETVQEATTTASASINGERALVTKVVDGDTVEISTGQTVRLIGIDTPETRDPRRPVGCFGKEASNETKNLLSGKEVILQKDVSETDKYGRLLRYVYLPLSNVQVLFVNDYLVREGFAKALTFPPDIKYNEQFRQAEREAREERRGLWERCDMSP